MLNCANISFYVSKNTVLKTIHSYIENSTQETTNSNEIPVIVPLVCAVGHHLNS
jgi:hypothetical protein